MLSFKFQCDSFIFEDEEINPVNTFNTITNKGRINFSNVSLGKSYN